MKKKSFKILLAATLTTTMLIPGITAYGASWQQETTGWRWQNDDGSYTSGTWKWIDGNGDGTAECYYFDGNGYLLTNTNTPDGYTVDGNGCWVVDGVVQTKNQQVPTQEQTTVVDSNAITGETSTYDPQHPLKGYMEKWLEADPETGATRWKWDPLNFLTTTDNHWEYVFDNAVKDKNPDYFTFYGNAELAVIAELTNYPQTGLEYVRQNEKEALVKEVRDFLNSFDWRHASDYEKAVQIAKRITKADYDVDSIYSYNCLAEGKANCQAYSDAAELLSTCVGLTCNSLGSASHSYPVFYVDGVWLAYEATTKDDYFTIANVYKPSMYLAGEPQLTQLGKYCKAIGYEIPEDVSDNFPNISYGVIYGENGEFIKFN